MKLIKSGNCFVKIFFCVCVWNLLKHSLIYESLKLGIFFYTQDLQVYDFYLIFKTYVKKVVETTINFSCFRRFIFTLCIFSCCVFQPAPKGQPPDTILRRCSAVLDPLTKAVPGLMEALYLQAKVKFLSGDVDGAQSALQHCLDQDTSYSDAHILMAQVTFILVESGHIFKKDFLTIFAFIT